MNKILVGTPQIFVANGEENLLSGQSSLDSGSPKHSGLCIS